MVPDKFNMVDMGGIDLILNQDDEIPGLYQKLVESIAQCRYQCLYNWKSDGVNIPPTYVELVVDPNNGNVLINSGVYVTPEDVLVMRASGERLPAGISFVSFIKPTTRVFTVAHGLGEVPDMVMIFQKSFDADIGTFNNPLMIFANPGLPQATGYDGRLVVNYLQSNEWEYTANSAFGWSADSTNVEIKIGSGVTPPFSDDASDIWYLIAVKFTD